MLESSRHLRSERGAILVYVAIAIVVLMGFSAFVLDYGVFMLARHQAQNAADAGALAGVFARVYDEPDVASTITSTTATSSALANHVIGDPPAVVVTAAAGTCPDFALPYGDTCVRVSVHSDTLPTYFARLLGVTTLSVDATATAQLRPANMTDCLKPLMLPDVGGVYSSSPPPPPDTPGYTLDRIGDVVTMDPDPTKIKTDPGFFVKINAGQGNTNLRHGIGGVCPSDSGEKFTINDLVPLAGYEDVSQFKYGLLDLIAADPGAYWDPSVKAVRGSCAPACGPHSPRIITVALFNPTDDPTSSPLQIRNFMSLFIDSVNLVSHVATTYITQMTGKLSSGSMPLAHAEFLKVVSAVR
jgi:Flp pilus assembly protein TadG